MKSNTIEATNNTHSTKPKAIICNETNEFFFSVCSAAKQLNCAPTTIKHILQGKTKNPRNGLTFRYATEEEISAVEKEIVVQPKSIVKGKGKRMNGNTKAVFDFSTGQFYTSATDAAEQLHTTSGHVSMVARTKGRTVKGKKICYVHDIPEHLDEIGNAIRKANMYDDMMTNEEKRKEMLDQLKHLEEDKDNISSEIYNLCAIRDDINKQIEQVKHDLIYFGIN